jgi:hypothetical protein
MYVVADVVTKARRSFPQSVSGRLAVFGVIGCGICTAGLFAALTSPLWVPTAIVSSIAFVGFESSRVLSARLKHLWFHAKNYVTMQLKAMLNPPPPTPTARSSSMKMLQRAAAIEDRRFLRGIFEGLPGVDTEGALQKIDAWKQKTLLDTDEHLRSEVSTIA